MDVVKKAVLRAGSGAAPKFADGAKVKLHISAAQDVESKTLLDTRKLHLGPFELRLGKKFVFGALETAVRTMLEGEVARFHLSAEAASGFSSLATVLRDESDKSHANCADGDHHHDHDNDHDNDHGHASCCGALQAQKKHADLIEAMGKPLLMDLELLEVQEPGEYKRDHWELTVLEKYNEIAPLKASGNDLYAKGDIEGAVHKYEVALGYIEAVLLASDPIGLTTDMLRRGQYRDVIKYASEILKIEPDNWKALCRRGQAYLEIGVDLELAKEDLDKAEQLQADPLLPKLQQRLQQAIQAAKRKEREMFGGLFLTKK